MATCMFTPQQYEYRGSIFVPGKTWVKRNVPSVSPHTDPSSDCVALYRGTIEKDDGPGGIILEGLAVYHACPMMVSDVITEFPHWPHGHNWHAEKCVTLTARQVGQLLANHARKCRLRGLCPANDSRLLEKRSVVWWPHWCELKSPPQVKSQNTVAL